MGLNFVLTSFIKPPSFVEPKLGKSFGLNDIAVDGVTVQKIRLLELFNLYFTPLPETSLKFCETGSHLAWELPYAKAKELRGRE